MLHGVSHLLPCRVFDASFHHFCTCTLWLLSECRDHYLMVKNRHNVQHCFARQKSGFSLLSCVALLSIACFLQIHDIQINVQCGRPCACHCWETVYLCSIMQGRVMRYGYTIQVPMKLSLLPLLETNKEYKPYDCFMAKRQEKSLWSQSQVTALVTLLPRSCTG